MYAWLEWRKRFAQNKAAALTGGVKTAVFIHRLDRSGDEAETRCRHGAGLAGHRAVEALTLERGRQVHFAALTEHAEQEFHDTSPCILVTRGAFA
jgi:hypothetical protein